MSKADRLDVFVVTKGHPFLRDPFETMLRAIGVEPTFVDQPAAAILLNPDDVRRYDAILFYDMPGLDFRAPLAHRPAAVPPDPRFVEGFGALLREGKGMVAMHHALAGWPAWPDYAEAWGGAFLYKNGQVRGHAVPSSGYAAGVRYQVRVVDPDHPVAAGLPERFELHDELYWCELFEDSITPLIVRETPVGADRFCSAMRAVRHVPDGEGEPWRPSAGSAILGWTKQTENSRLVYLQPGDGPDVYENAVYRQLLGNALRWVARRSGRGGMRSDQQGLC